MPVVTDPNLAKKILQQVENLDRKAEEFPVPEPRESPDTVFQLCGGYESDTGLLVSEFEVRELTGRDEEYLGRIKDSSKMMIAMLGRGLVRIGDEPVSDSMLDGLVSGDWEMVLLAIRVVTFGQTFVSTRVCRSCGEEYEAHIDLLEDITFKRLADTDRVFEVTGKRGDVYRATPAFGYAQRRIMLRSSEETLAEMSTMMLKDCLQSINDRPVLTKGEVLDLPMADRRLLLDEIDKRRVGPDLSGVMTKCPTCNEEQSDSLNIVALFQG